MPGILFRLFSLANPAKPAGIALATDFQVGMGMGFDI